MFAREFKEKVLQECIRFQESKIKIVHDAMSEHQKMANEYGPPRDRYDSFRSQLLHKRDLFAAQYQNGLDDLTILQKVDASLISEKVEFGSLVITKQQKIYVALGLGKINVDGNDVFVVSPKVPVYQAMEGLRESEKFVLNKNEFVIEQII